ncbi:MAG: cyanophycin synthetase, partial [Xanthomonadales bacterium]|nr:cyanophycin synthetase [Xanthomonadales bacterium]
MKILATNVYLGPSLYAHFPVIRHQVDIGILEEWPSVRLGADFIDALVKALPGLSNHGCSFGESGGLLRRLREDEGTWMAHIWEHAAIELQNMAGSDVSFGKTRSIGPVGHYNMVFQYKQKDVGLEAARISRQLLLNLLPGHLKETFSDELEAGFDFAQERDDFIRFAQ